MPRRFALLLLALLFFLLAAFVVARRVLTNSEEARVARVPTPMPTPKVPPTPIPPRRVALYFESAEDGQLHPEARDVPASADDVALLRTIASAVFEGPRKEGLLRPFPEGWRLRAAYRLKDGLVVLDLDPPRPVETPTPGLFTQPPPRWETGVAEELPAAQALVTAVTRNLPDATRVVLLVAGEPAETLAGHVDLAHPLLPDPRVVADEPPGDPPPTATASPTPTTTPTVTPTPTPARRKPPKPRSAQTA